MIARLLVLFLVFNLVASTGCRSAEIVQVQGYKGEPVQQPRRIYVYDFRSEDARVLAADEDTDTAKLASDTATALSLALVDELEDFQIPIERATGPMDVPENSLAIHGELLIVDEGSRAKRVFLGFGSGKTRVDTHARLYVRGDQGPQKIAEYKTMSDSGWKPGILTTLPIGMAVQGLSLMLLAIQGGMATFGELNSVVSGDAKETADEWAEALQTFFEENGWLDEDPDSMPFD